MNRAFSILAVLIFFSSCNPVFAQTQYQWVNEIFYGSVTFNANTATTVPYLDSNKTLQSSSTTPTELGFVHGVNSALCGVSDSCTLTNKTISGASNTISNISLSAQVTGTLPIANGGTGQITASTAINALLPSQSGASGDCLTSNGSAAAWSACSSGGFANPMTTLGDIIAGGASGTPTRYGAGANGTNIIANSNDTLGMTYVQTPGIMNLGLATSVATNAMTVTLTGAGGSAPSASSPVVVPFRSATSATGTYSQVLRTSTLAVVIPASATLGQTSAVNQYVWVYLVSDSGLDLCFSGVKLFDDLSVQSATAISSSATSGTTLYCGSSHTSMPIRLVGRLLVNETTAGTWASNATEVSLNPTPRPNVTDPVSYAPTWTGLGTVTGNTMWTWREGNLLVGYGTVTAGTTAGSAVTFTLQFNGSSVTSDSNILGTTNFIPVGNWLANATSGSTLGLKGGVSACSFFNTAANGQTQALGTGVVGSSGAVTVTFRIPIVGWSKYGP